MNAFNLSSLLVVAWVVTLVATLVVFIVLLFLAMADIPTGGTDLAKLPPFARGFEIMSGRYDQYRSAVRLRAAAKALAVEWILSLLAVATIAVLQGAGVIGR